MSKNVLENVKWVKFDARITGSDGEVFFEQKDVEFPDFWTQQAVDIVASKYFYGQQGTPERETSLKQVAERIASTIARAGMDRGYFARETESIKFRDAIIDLIVYQKAAFNSPVWFNIGTPGRQQASACFINSIEDSMEGIMELATAEAKIFKWGSGAGTNLSKLRGKGEKLSGGGTASGPMSFLRGFDSFAGVIKSGGRCLAPDQHVYTSNGPVKISELAERDGGSFVALSYDPPAGRYKAKKATAWHAGEKTLVRITTDKGQFKLSIDHPVRLSTGEYVEAGELKIGQSLFAGSVDLRDGYLRVHLRNGKKGKKSMHRLVAADVKGETIKGFSVHHIDGNKLNNCANNLQVMPQSEHMTLHGKESAARGEHVFQKRKFPQPGAENPMHASSDFWKDAKKVKSFKKKQRDILNERGDAAVMQVIAARQKMINTAYRLINAGHTIETFDEYLVAREQVIGRIGCKKKVRRSIDERFGSYENFTKVLTEENHRIQTIEVLGTSEVYDVEVECPTADDKTPETGHNFLIWPNDSLAGTGIVVANTRRAAKMVILDVDHPDIEDFIDSKSKEEAKALALINAGYDNGFNVEGGAYDSVFFQNANHTVKVNDEFMRAARDNKTYWLRGVKDPDVDREVNAKDLLRKIAQAAWESGDPGLQYDGAIQRMHTCKASGPINASNPCSEYLFLDDTACNLASLNLLKYLNPNGTFQIEEFKQTVRTLITAQDILVDFAEYPTDKIARKTVQYRTLGLGYANLGALLMASGYPYDSDEGRDLAAAITALMCGEAYRQSACLAEQLGPFAGYNYFDLKTATTNKRQNKTSMRDVIMNHAADVALMHSKSTEADRTRPIWDAAYTSWREAVEHGEEFGFRNAQTTVLAPTGTISFAMGCDTTGIEPDLALVKYKKMVGGGMLKIVNQTIPLALKNFGYSQEDIDAIIAYIEANDTIEGAPGLHRKHLPTFDCAFKPEKGERVISWQGHVKMMIATQPFISGAISKTVNLPNTASVDDILDAYIMAWENGLKALAVYRDGCKNSQPLNTGDGVVKAEPEATTIAPTPVPHKRRRLPDTRRSVTHKFSVAGNEGYITVGTYDDGSPGEMFITMSKEGSVVSGLMDSFATSISMGLQYGVPLEVLVDKFKHVRFEPSGYTSNPSIRIAKSLVDYIFRWMEIEFTNRRYVNEGEGVIPEVSSLPRITDTQDLTTNPCTDCGGITIRAGACDVCTSCGTSTGCG